jgi:5-methylcytosine-specific restriction protein A
MTARAVPEWVGKRPESMPPRTVYDRLYDKQGGKDAITGVPFTSKDKIVRDHIAPLIDGGANTESNLQLVTEHTHKLKTAREAMERGKERSVRAKHRGYVTGQPKRQIQSPRFRRPPSNTRQIYADVEEENPQ